MTAIQSLVTRARNGFCINGYVSADTEREGGGGRSGKDGIGKDVLTRLDKDLRRECGGAMERSNVSSWSQFQLPSSIKATRAPDILRSTVLHYPLSPFRLTFYPLFPPSLFFPFHSFSFSLLLEEKDRVIELEINRGLEEFRRRAHISHRG